jgi:SAM-dependent methyltransferase
MSDRARSFDGAAALYAAARPDYPTAALPWLLPADARRVLDLGAGTGKLTRQLIDRGLEVVAVEPSPQMGVELAACVPEAELREGGAEQIPLPDGDVDAVLAGQAFHWFDRDRALPEIARVLRSGGWLGILRHIDDDRVPWVDALAAVTGNTARASRQEPDVIETDLFGDIETAEFPHGQLVDGESLRRLIQTHSFYLVQDPAGQAEVVRRIDELVSTHPDLAGRSSFVLPYLIRCWRGTRR